MHRVLIIGGGPAGLALGAALKHRAVPHLILEAGPRLGNTFRKMAANTTFGPWLNNALPYSQIPLVDWLRRTHREEFAQYLSDYAMEQQLDYRTGVRVHRVTKPHDFRVETDEGDLQAQLVVNATGYFSRPHTVDYPGRESSRIRQIHASEFREPCTVSELLGKDRGRVLIVGKRLTAGETMQRLVKAGFEVSLSARSPIEFGPAQWLEACMSPFTFLVEETLARLPGSRLPSNLDVKMSGGLQRQLVESGQVAVYPDILEFRENTVVFRDGREAAFDLVIYATGYRPALNHLAELVKFDPKTGCPVTVGFESIQVPGLYFLGLIGLNTFRSQFLRGIREDALCLAEILAEQSLSPSL